MMKRKIEIMRQNYNDQDFINDFFEKEIIAEANDLVSFVIEVMSAMFFFSFLAIGIYLMMFLY